MKKIFYIFMFTLLGVFLQFIAHGLLEIWYIGLLLKNFPRYGFGLSWNVWVIIHNWGTALLLAAGFHMGLRQGRYWWRRIYDTV